MSLCPLIFLSVLLLLCFFFFFFNDPATTEIYPLPLHDALPIYRVGDVARVGAEVLGRGPADRHDRAAPLAQRSEEHTSELQSLTNLVCRLLLEKKKNAVEYAAIPSMAYSRCSEKYVI